MRSRLATVPAGRTDRLLALLEQVEAMVGDLSAGELLDLIGQTARLETVLHERYVALTGRSQTPAAPPPDEPRYLAAAAAADYMGISRSTVLRLANAGRLRSCRPSQGTVRFDRADLDAYMTETRQR